MTPTRLYIPSTFIALIVLTVLVLSNLPMGQCRNPGVTILSDTGNDIVVHCKSGDTDIGEKNLPYGKMLHWSFHPNAGMSTLYWCNFSWFSPAAGHSLHAKFDVWSANVISNYLEDSSAWKVEKDGFYIYDVTQEMWERKYLWSTTGSLSFTT